jgi:hypothetical protein
MGVFRKVTVTLLSLMFVALVLVTVLTARSFQNQPKDLATRDQAEARDASRPWGHARHGPRHQESVKRKQPQNNMLH